MTWTLSRVDLVETLFTVARYIAHVSNVRLGYASLKSTLKIRCSAQAQTPEVVYPFSCIFFANAPNLLRSSFCTTSNFIQTTSLISSFVVCLFLTRLYRVLLMKIVMAERCKMKMQPQAENKASSLVALPDEIKAMIVSYVGTLPRLYSALLG